MSDLSLGELVERYRTVRGIKADTLAEHLEVSKRTYYRLVAGNADFTIDQYFASMAYLKIDVNEVDATLRQLPNSKRQAITELAAGALGPKDEVRLQAAGVALNRPGLLAVAMALHIQQTVPLYPAQADEQVTRFLAKLTTSDCWTDCDWQLFMAVGPHCTFDQLFSCLRKYSRIQLRWWTWIYQSARFPKLSMLLLNAGLHTGPAELFAAADWINTQPVTPIVLNNRVYKAVARAIKIYLRDPEAGRQAYHKVEAAADFFWPRQPGYQSMPLPQVWSVLEEKHLHLRSNAKIPELAAAQGDLFASGQTRGEQIDALRRYRHLSVEKLCKYTGISRASYYRLINGDQRVKLTSLIWLLDELGVDLREFVEIFPNAERRWLAAVEDYNARMTASGGEIAPAELARWHAALEKRAVAEDDEYYHWIGEWIYIDELTNAGNSKAAAEHAQAMLNHFTKLDSWNNYDLNFVMRGAAMAASPAMVPVFTRLLRRAEKVMRNPYGGSQQTTASVVQHLVIACMQARDPQLAQKLRQLVEPYDQPTFDLSTAIYVRVLDIIPLAGQGRTPEIQPVFAKILAQLNVFYDVNDPSNTLAVQVKGFEQELLAASKAAGA